MCAGYKWTLAVIYGRRLTEVERHHVGVITREIKVESTLEFCLLFTQAAVLSTIQTSVFLLKSIICMEILMPA